MVPPAIFPHARCARARADACELRVGGLVRDKSCLDKFRTAICGAVHPSKFKRNFFTQPHIALSAIFSGACYDFWTGPLHN